MDLGLKPRPNSETWAPNHYAIITPTSFCVVLFHCFISNLDSACFLPFFKLSASKPRVCLLFSGCLPACLGQAPRPHFHLLMSLRLYVDPSLAFSFSVASAVNRWVSSWVRSSFTATPSTVGSATRSSSR